MIEISNIYTPLFCTVFYFISHPTTWLPARHGPCLYKRRFLATFTKRHKNESHWDQEVKIFLNPCYQKDSQKFFTIALIMVIGEKEIISGYLLNIIFRLPVSVYNKKYLIYHPKNRTPWNWAHFFVHPSFIRKEWFQAQTKCLDRSEPNQWTASDKR